MNAQAPRPRVREDEKLAGGNEPAAACGCSGQATVPEREDYWQRFMDTLYEAQVTSAQREIARHQDLMAFLRRRLVERFWSA